MVKAWRYDKAQKGVGAIKMENVADPMPANGQVKVRNIYAGLNRIDIQAANGLCRTLNSHGILGFEAYAEVEECGSNTTRFKVKDKVLYATNPAGGALAEYTVLNEEYLVPAPDNLDPKVLAAHLYKSLTAHYIVSRVFIVRKGFAVLIHNAAQAGNQIISQWCNARGAYVIGTVLDSNDKDVAKKSGCYEVFHYKEDDWVQKLRDVSLGYGINCIIDSLGSEVYEQSIASLMKAGLLIVHEEAISTLESINIKDIAEKALYVTAPNLFDYKRTLSELILCVEDVCNAFSGGLITPLPIKEIPFTDVHDALHEMENKRNLYNTFVVKVT